jgi:transposase
MVKAFTNDLRWRVIFHTVMYGASSRETAAALFVSLDFVHKVRRLYRTTGRATALSTLTRVDAFLAILLKRLGTRIYNIVHF